jgi:hypothetical protein
MIMQPSLLVLPDLLDSEEIKPIVMNAAFALLLYCSTDSLVFRVSGMKGLIILFPFSSTKRQQSTSHPRLKNAARGLEAENLGSFSWLHLFKEVQPENISSHRVCST